MAAAEQAVVTLIQSVRLHSAKSERVAIFSQLLGLRSPAIPSQGFYVLRAIERALKAPMQGAAAVPQVSSGQPLSAQQLLQQQQAQPVLEDDNGAVCWVQPARLRSVISGLFATITDGNSSKAALKRVGFVLQRVQAKEPPCSSRMSFIFLCAHHIRAWCSSNPDSIAPDSQVSLVIFSPHF